MKNIMLILCFLIFVIVVYSHSWDGVLGSIYKEEPIVRVEKSFYYSNDTDCEYPLLSVWVDYHEETYPEPIEIQDPLEFCIKKNSGYRIGENYIQIEKCRIMPYKDIYGHERKVVCFTCGENSVFTYNHINYNYRIIDECYYSRERPGFRVKYIPRKTQMIDNDLYILE
jgi:hypothetical protein